MRFGDGVCEGKFKMSSPVRGISLHEVFNADAVNPESKESPRSKQHIAKTPVQKRQKRRRLNAGPKVPVYYVTPGSLRFL
jgi:hypothetical protein